MATAKWATPAAISTIFNGDATAPTIKGLAAAGTKIDTVVRDNLTDLHLYGAYELKVRFAVAPAAGAVVELYAVLSLDDTNYEDGSDSATPHLAALLCAIPVDAVATQQVIGMRNIVLPPFKFKYLLKNTGGQAFTNTDNENVLKGRHYSEQVT